MCPGHVPSPLAMLRKQVYIPHVEIPHGRMLDLPDRGSTFVTDTPGPAPEAPVIVLCHAVGCTGLLTWFAAITQLAQTHRVITLDQRWHGRGIDSEDFSLRDCADDTVAVMDELGVGSAIIAGYSMGGIIAQRVWRQHRARVDGLVLCATTDHFRRKPTEKAFFTGMELSMHLAHGLSAHRTAASVARATVGVLDLGPSDIHEWAMAEFRSTSPWAVAQAVAALGRHHSRPWLSQIDVPTAVVVTRHDRVIPAKRQIALARRIPGATIHDIDAGHAGIVLESETFNPALLEAVATVSARVRAARSTRRPRRRP